MSRNTNTKRSGFTLVELLITLTILALLAAVIIPVVVQQVSAANGPKAVADLTAIRSGIENFTANLRGANPGDLEDLVNQINGSDLDIADGAYSTPEQNRWNGPYVDLAIATGNAITGTVFYSGYDAEVQADLTLCGINLSAACGTTTTDFVVVQLYNLNGTAAGTINELIDGSNETATATAGKFRYDASVNSGTGYFYAVPNTN